MELLWNLGKEEKEKRMMEHEDVYGKLLKNGRWEVKG
jgi:hypothetical protein